jgi:hypothetical protein
MCDLDRSILAGAENTDNWHTKNGDLQRAFALDVSMVRMVPTIATGDTHLFLASSSLKM